MKSLELSAFVLQTSTALIYDATMILAEALKQIGFDHLQVEYEQGINCFDTKSSWSKGLTITNYMKSVCAKRNIVYNNRRE